MPHRVLWFRRARHVVRVSAGNAAIGMVVALSVWLLVGFATAAKRGHEAALETSRLSTVIEELDATEWRVRVEGVTPAADATFREYLAEGDRLALELSTHGA